MSLNEIVVGCRNKLKQNYRTRYYGNRGQAIPDLKPGDNAVSFVNNYLNVTVSNSDCEDNLESNISRRLLSERGLRIQKNGANLSSTKSCVHDTPHRSQGGGNSVTQSDSSKSDNAIKKNRKQPDVTYHRLFSDDESDDEGTHLVAKLIEESLTENEDIVDFENVNVEKPTEKLYSSDTSAVQEPPSPTSNIHAKKWLSFKNSTFATNNNVFTNQLPRRSEEFPNNAQQLEASKSIKENLYHADITYDLLTASSDNGPENEFVIEEENRCNIDTWVSPPKKKKLSLLSTKTKRDEGTSTPKKTNSNEAFSILQKKSKNMKASLISSTTAERLSSKVSEAPPPSAVVNSSEEEFEIEDISDIIESNFFTIPVVAKSMQTGVNKKEIKVTVQLHPNKPVNSEPNNPLMPSHTEGNERHKTALSPDVEGVEQQTISQHAALREGSEEQVTSSQVSHLPQVVDEDSENEDFIPLPVQIQESDSDHTGSVSLNNIEKVQLKQRRKSQRKKSDQRAEQIFGHLDETFSIKNRKGKTNLQVVEIPSGLQKKSKNVKGSPICSTMAKRLSSKVSEAPPPSAVVNSSEEEFEIEDISDIIGSNFFTIPVMAKSMQTGVNKKEIKVTVQLHPNKPVNLEPNNDFTPSHTDGNETLLHKAASSPHLEGIELQPISQHAALRREGSEEQVASSQDTHLPLVADEDSENEDSVPLLVPIEESHIDNTGSSSSNNIEQVQQLQKIKSPRTKRDQHAELNYGLSDNTFSIKNTRGQTKNSRAADKKKKTSKKLEEEQKNQLVKEKKAKKNVAEKTQESNKQRKSSKAKQNELECAKDYMSNDNEAEEVKETSATRRSSRKRKNTGEMLKENKKKNVQAIVCRQPDHEDQLEMNNCDGQQTEEDMHIPAKERNAKLRNNRPSYPASHTSEESVLQSGPVTRQRAVRFVEPGKPIAYDLDVPDIATGAEEENCSVEDEEPIGNSEAKKELLKHYSIIVDPETGSDTLLECIVQGEMSKFFGDDSCKYWTTFNNSIFTTGKLIIAPKKKREKCIVWSDIVIYYVEKGKVQLNLHKTEQILKDGDFFYVPPGSGCTIANLQDKEAVLVYNCIKILPLSTG